MTTPEGGLYKPALLACMLVLAALGAAAWFAIGLAEPPDAGMKRMLLFFLSCAALCNVLVIALLARRQHLEHPPATQDADALEMPARATHADKTPAPHALVIDENARILALNEALLSFSRLNSVGMNYLEVCERANAHGVVDAERFAAGLRAVLDGKMPQFSMDYSCSVALADHWYRATVSRLLPLDPPRFLIVHEDITWHRDMENALRQSALSVRELAEHQEVVREEERKRIAQEIHDDLGQQLLALRIDLSILQASQAGNPALVSQLDGMQTTIGNLVHSVRAIINDLRPAVLDLGLHAAAEWQLNDFTQKTGIDSRLLANFPDIDLPDSHATALFRVLQESLTNVSRHSGASRVEVRLKLEDGKLLMRIADNGLGMSTDAHKPGSFGLRGMRERIMSLGGELDISSAPEEGVTVSVQVPLAGTDAQREGYVHRSPVDRRASRRTG
ncbi:sensor histidine kinase [Noviherbaspirillum pedocola]|uniref:Sensor histidine kinase n=1 Tax=Noviherbaspirillum pedocola TaxID=2801341 RepID=A0A934SXH3_9BURK|nr:sensor histidine kinase [Noviherbaspirillum pedocola]MBK4737557.1 sensor histidine kinase [Noviherbaspirillum pedocola]